MARRAANEADLWFGVLDPRKRKQIQDRLAQRARRKRLAEKKADLPSGEGKEDSNSLVLFSQKPGNSNGKSDPGTFSMSTAQVESISQNSESPLSSDHRLLALPEHNLYSALFHNGVILGLPCSTSNISISPSASAHVPAPLRPTLLQVQVVHFQWIDRIPLPRVRDKMIHYTDKWSAEEFLGDIFSTESFYIKPGRMSWDSTAWVVAKGFREKWRLLFDDIEVDKE